MTAPALASQSPPPKAAGRPDRRPALSIRGMLLTAIVVGVVLPALMVLLLDQDLARRTLEPGGAEQPRRHPGASRRWR
ncbi:MAG: hypothetical protein IPM99_01305 [Rubrivivax sp.]|nr:hypothetical protein [Rubrivivax sp.]